MRTGNHLMAGSDSFNPVRPLRPRLSSCNRPCHVNLCLCAFKLLSSRHGNLCRSGRKVCVSGLRPFPGRLLHFRATVTSSKAPGMGQRGCGRLRPGSPMSSASNSGSAGLRADRENAEDSFCVKQLIVRNPAAQFLICGVHAIISYRTVWRCCWGVLLSAYHSARLERLRISAPGRETCRGWRISIGTTGDGENHG
jgi:hypothetical protein